MQNACHRVKVDNLAGKSWNEDLMAKRVRAGILLLIIGMAPVGNAYNLMLL